MKTKKPQLYVKNDKGLYEPYVEPVQEYDNKLYRKVGNRYESCSMLMDDDLGEGVWVVVKHEGCKSFTSGKYILDRYMCLRAGDIQPVSLAKLGGMEKITHELSRHWNELPRDVSQYDLVRAVVGLMFKYCNDES